MLLSITVTYRKINQYEERDCAKLQHLEKHLHHCLFAYHKAHTNWSELNPGLQSDRPLTNHLSHDTACHAIKMSFGQPYSLHILL